MSTKNIYFAYLLLFFTAIFSCTKESEPTLFHLRTPAQSGIDFVNHVYDEDSLNIIQYLYYYNGGGVAIGDINNDGLSDIYFSSNKESNRLYLNKGNLQFQDITETAGVSGSGTWTTGVNMVDINNDGFLDIYVCQVGNYKHFQGKNQLFINDGAIADGLIHFTESAEAYGLDYEGFSTQSAFMDYDLDGDLDMYLLCHSVHSTDTYKDTSFTRKRDMQNGDRLFRNDLNNPSESGKYFTEVSEQAGIFGGIAGYGLGIAVGDIDKNGCPDIYIGNDFHENDFLYFNNCDGTFSENLPQTMGHVSNFSMGNDLADFNNDTWLDIITLDMKPEDEITLKNAQGSDPYDIYRFKRSFGYHHQFPRNMLQLNRGQFEQEKIRFSEIGQLAGISATDWSWSALFADFDNDGWKDLHITNGIIRRPNDLDYLKFIANRSIQEKASDLELAAQMPDGKASNYIFSNNGDWTFRDHTKHWGIHRPSLSNGAAYADLDNDGDLDLVVNNINDPAFLYENLADRVSSGHFLQVQCKGSDANPFGLGVKVTLFYAGKKQYQEMYPVRGWQSSVDYRLHFGVGETLLIDSMIVEWPDGKQERRISVNVDQNLVFEYANATPMQRRVDEKVRSYGLFQPAPIALTPAYRHQENHFYDNNREPLIPYLLSTQGPPLAVGDVNGDGREDFFVGGASMQAGHLFLQTPEGTFMALHQPDFLADSLREDVAAVLLDADGDGDLDLFVASAGNQFYHEDEALKDRLYVNDGKGVFSKRKEALPEIADQSSCVTPGDFDKDGDLDLFIGGRSVPVSYGIGPDSYLLENDGKGNFTNISSRIPELSNMGMVTDAAWTDVDSDDDPDLVVVGEWMPLTIFVQDKGRFVKREIPNSSGWWTTIATADFDQDGDEDWIVGNFGMNSNLQPSVNEPVKIYIGDFDRNLSRDPIISYYRQQKEYPFAGLDELSSQLILLKKRFRQYHQFSVSTIEEVFTPEELSKTVQLEVQEFHSVFVRNKGRGNVEIEYLPLPVQLAPVRSIVVADFDEDGLTDALLGGNFYDIQPSIGRQDALYGTLLKGLGDGTFEVMENERCGLLLEGQVRGMELLKAAGKSILLVARNDDSLQIYSLNPPLNNTPLR